MSQYSSYRMDSVPCTVPAAHNHQLRTSEIQHNSLYSNNATIKHAAHTEREREGEKEGEREGRQRGREGGKEGGKKGGRGREGGKGGRKEGKEGEREGLREGHLHIHSIYIHPPTLCICIHSYVH